MSNTFLVVSPEYNGSMPPVLTNAVAWVSRVDKDFRTVFNQKFVALATHSGGGGNKGNDAMRSMFAYLGANVLSRELICTYKKECEERTMYAIIDELSKFS
jgi:NAD(P)H-dependent FMN reductase